jgi:hypothetical protein
MRQVMAGIRYALVIGQKAIVKDGLLKEQIVELQPSNRGFEKTSLCSQAERDRRRNEDSTPTHLTRKAMRHASNAW